MGHVNVESERDRVPHQGDDRMTVIAGRTVVGSRWELDPATDYWFVITLDNGVELHIQDACPWVIVHPPVH
jgi:hypothetical protein